MYLVKTVQVLSWLDRPTDSLRARPTLRNSKVCYSNTTRKYFGCRCSVASFQTPASVTVRGLSRTPAINRPAVFRRAVMWTGSRLGGNDLVRRTSRRRLATVLGEETPQWRHVPGQGEPECRRESRGVCRRTLCRSKRSVKTLTWNHEYIPKRRNIELR